MSMRNWLIVALLPLALAGGAQGSARSGNGAGRCTATALQALYNRDAGVTVTSARFNPAAAAQGTSPALPAHCEITGEIGRRIGADGQSYAIRFHLRLPQAWNRRFFFQGGGGSNGVIGDALGNLQGGRREVALQLGYAVVSQDSGHDNATNNRPDRGGVISFGFDYQARRDYAFASLGKVTAAAKALIARYYGHAPQFSYFVSCSKGGQEAMQVAHRLPGQFDGVMAVAPGFALPKAALAQAWDTRAFLRLARAEQAAGSPGFPSIGRTFSDTDLGLVSSAVLKACDGLDGAEDGIVSAVGQCTGARVRPAVEGLVCTAGKGPSCLSRGQIDTLFTVMDGARWPSGLPVYASWPWDPGIGGQIGTRSYGGWRAWKLGSADATRPDALNVTLGGASLAIGFLTPPTAISNNPAVLQDYIEQLDWAEATPGIFRTAPGFPLSTWDLMAARSDDLGPFSAMGGKLLVLHGAADPVFSLQDTIDWWNALDAARGGHAADFSRLFPVPGMNHCRGGPGTTSFDAFSALVGWVERRQAPARIVATAPEDTPWPGRSRPLCAWPETARYNGSGSLEDAAGFACVAPGGTPNGKTSR